ncbi:transporter [Changchengzhania lutea]|uniref:transporter n=1 Tax=Changchengzhania lutea TaxID=2049305 RepID=UPI00115D88C3|nr:transporter [Changchengzhania lutea]
MYPQRFIILIVLLLFLNVNAQTCCSGGIPLSNNIGLPNYEKGTLQVGLSYDYNNLNTLNEGSNTLNDNSRLRITHSVLLNTSYSITDHLSAEGLFTWVSQRRKITQFGNQNLDKTSGVGDAVILMKYNFNKVLGASSSFALGLGAKLPLGSSTKKNNQGITLNADLQPGSNAWDVIYWLSSSKNFDFRPSFTFSTRFTYRGTGTNNTYLENSTYKFGNEFQAFLGFSDEFLLLKTIVNTSISFKYRNAIKDKIDGFDLDNTGGDWVFLIPSFSMALSPNLSFSVKAELPLYSHVDGTQLTPTYRLTTGLLYRIKPRLKLGLINI